jgi:hypothetical protein
MRAVPVAAGGHTIRLGYSPPGLVGAAIVSSLQTRCANALQVAQVRAESRKARASFFSRPESRTVGPFRFNKESP